MPPKILKLETSTVCNTRCIFCSHQDLQRVKKFMDRDLALQVVEEVSTIVEEVQPQWFGEPMLYPHIREVVDLALGKGLRVVYYTNGSKPPIPATRVIFSVEYHTQELLDKLRPGLKLDTIVKNVEDYIATGGEVFFRGVECEENKIHLPAIHRFWGKYGKFVSVPEFPRTREVRDEPIPMEAFGDCNYTFNQIIVNVDGWVVPCCTDYECTIRGGNARDGVMKAWNSETLTNFRKDVADKKWPALCYDCGFRWR